jgi:alkanesulfonate monooxygenase SsuD/methylene tetrahydromethanopterin reductase-like flavin-dependent oxidoreductase (luciferase family)
MIEGQEGVTWEQWLALAQRAEAGLEGLFRSDHYLSIVRGGEAGSLDAWATLSALAARTERVRLGALVSPVTFRHASVLAKCAVTVDHVSSGRIELGVGAGWYEAEHHAYGFAFPPVRERLAALEQYLSEIRRQWSDGTTAWPKPVQHPSPPVIVGGSAKPGTVSAAVRYADEYNTTFATPEVCAERRRILDEACRAAGREPLRLSLMTGCIVGRGDDDLAERVRDYLRLLGREHELEAFLRDPPPHMVVGTLQAAADQLRAYQAAGVERVMLQHLVHEDVEMVSVLCELADAVA